MKEARNLVCENMLEMDKLENFKAKTYTKQDNDEATQDFKKMFNYYIKYEFREQILDELVKKFANDELIFKNLYMSEKELIKMHENKMILGSHSVKHFVFSKLSENEQIKEIHHSFDFLEQLLTKLETKLFCYPYGGFHTFTDFTEKSLSEFGVAFSFNVESRDTKLEDLKMRPQALPRYDCNEFDFGKASFG
ncbi:polysaccharide deacetylase family protein [Campylobacter sp. MIT 12-5580]|uniref:polysaccharide deacetylase family protein n=1 Tax=Campylobacter sp. MIT 12-5580 TaxID=2040651 RepID=UPI002018361E|nr:polysaccharide deacetylase family protein [Campylobacter sp. MIT 12-5580]